MRTERDNFLASVTKGLEGVCDTLAACGMISLDTLAPEKTVLIAMDMTNGFAKAGALYSPRVKALIPAIERVSVACSQKGILQLSLMDSHPEASLEFLAYPPHCIRGTEESELVEELQGSGAFTLIRKNSTNGFLEPEFQQWLAAHEAIDTFIIVGDCTDICIQQFATTLKCSFNRINRPSQVIVPMNSVDTFDFGVHNGELMHTMALMMMQGSGVEVVRGIDYE